MRERNNDPLRELPSVDAILLSLGLEGAPHTTGAVRRALDDARSTVREGGPVPSTDEIATRARYLLASATHAELVPVVNATGVLIHTNLGRVPLGPAQLEAVVRVASGYSNLEYDLVAGSRGSRYSHARPLITALTGAESAVVVNNNAGAVLLSLAALCAGREVIISRGELVEIGGEFRIPDVMTTAGARLVEVGTTNRTHLADYERAIGPDTAAILKVHPSNYTIVGFTSSVASRDVCRLAAGRGVHMIHDLGSGLPSLAGATWMGEEPTFRTALQEGADVVMGSGDKLLGGPQCGIIAGRAALIDEIERHALIRTLRVDKMTLAVLEATLQAHLNGDAERDLPLWLLASATSEQLETRAHALAQELTTRGIDARAQACTSVPGGGAAPGVELPSWGVLLSDERMSPDEIARRLRSASTPIIGRVTDDGMLLDLRSVIPDQDGSIVGGVVRSLAANLDQRTR
ncbi:MAG TPA: L-seryl-tRNA(Sec) selenium transferase [Actinomycetota bacterium]|nr:L-seryl-tRNA(Sec) selenium transferase [Actinomycetota bacterium]